MTCSDHALAAMGNNQGQISIFSRPPDKAIFIIKTDGWDAVLLSWWKSICQYAIFFHQSRDAINLYNGVEWHSRESALIETF